MQDTLIQRLAKRAQQDGLSLPCSMRFLMEKLERDEQRRGRLRGRDTREGESGAQQLRLEAEAWALVLEALRRAYPAGGDLSFDGGSKPEVWSTFWHNQMLRERQSPLPTQQERITTLERTIRAYRPVLQNVAYELTMGKGLTVTQTEITQAGKQDMDEVKERLTRLEGQLDTILSLLKPS